MEKHDEAATAYSRNNDDEDTEEETKKEWLRFLNTLSPFPNSFHLQVEQMSDSACHNLLNMFKSEAQTPFDNPHQNARMLNLLAFFVFLSGSPKEAADLTEEVLRLEGENHNLTALGNRAAMLWRSGKHHRAMDRVKDLEILRSSSDQFQYLVLKAKSELAYSYCRLGPSFAALGTQLFTEIVPKGRYPEVSMWKFGLAFAKRGGYKVLSPMLSVKEEANLMDVVQLLMEVIDETDSAYLKAISYAELAYILQARSGTELEKKLEEKIGLTALEACDRALGLNTEACSVLWKCGHIYRQAQMLEKSCELLEKAVSKRQTSAQYFQLGQTYKALAIKQHQCDDKCVDVMNTIKISGAIQSERKNLINSNSNQLNDATGNCSSDQNQGTYSSSIGSLGKSVSEVNLLKGATDNKLQRESDTSESIKSNQKELTTTLETDRKEDLKLSRGDTYVQKAIDSLQKAIDLSKENENAPVTIELALLHRDLGELKEALCLLNKVLLKKQMRPFEKIHAYEKAGLILKTMSKQPERNEEEKMRLKEDYESMLRMALLLCSRLCNKLPGLQFYIQNEWLAFPELLKAVEKSDRNHVERLQEKAELFHMIRDYSKSLSLLQDIASMAPEEAVSKEHLKMKIENYVGEGKFQQALTFISVLKCTAQGWKTDGSIFPDGQQYVLSVYVKAAQTALLSSDSSTTSGNATEFFKAAYGDFFHNQSDSSETASSASEDDSLSGKDDDYDLMLVHDDSTEEPAMALKELIIGVYGLSATRMDEDCMPGRLYLDYMAHIMRKCRQVVVLTGCKKVEHEVRSLMKRAAKKPRTVSLIVDGGHVPSQLQSRPSMMCPRQLFARSNEQISDDTEDTRTLWVQAVCDFFNLLIGPSKRS